MLKKSFITFPPVRSYAVFRASQIWDLSPKPQWTAEVNLIIIFTIVNYSISNIKHLVTYLSLCNIDKLMLEMEMYELDIYARTSYLILRCHRCLLLSNVEKLN
jgi:hypothetical protein